MGTDHRPLVLLTGASGYIGGRLLRALEAAGRPVRCLARHPEFLRSRVSNSTQVIQADCLDRASLAPAMAGVQTAYYFVHSMGSAGQFEAEDRQAAQNFADAAREQGVNRIVYLGGLGNQDQSLSAHLRSRHEVADILRSSGVPTIEFRASIVIGHLQPGDSAERIFLGWQRSHSTGEDWFAMLPAESTQFHRLAAWRRSSPTKSVENAFRCGFAITPIPSSKPG